MRPDRSSTMRVLIVSLMISTSGALLLAQEPPASILLGRPLAYSPDGKLIAMADGSDAVILRDAPARPNSVVSTIPTARSALAISPDSTMLATGGDSRSSGSGTSPRASHARVEGP